MTYRILYISGKKGVKTLLFFYQQKEIIVSHSITNTRVKSRRHADSYPIIAKELRHYKETHFLSMHRWWDEEFLRTLISPPSTATGCISQSPLCAHSLPQDPSMHLPRRQGTYLSALQVPIINSEPPCFPSAVHMQSLLVPLEYCDLVLDCFVWERSCKQLNSVNMSYPAGSHPMHQS